MEDRHPSPTLLQLITRLDAQPEDLQTSLLQHVLFCDHCRNVLRSQRTTRQEGDRPAHDLGPLQVSRPDAAPAPDGGLGAALWAELAHLPLERQLLLLSNTRRFQCFELLAELLDRCRGAVPANPHRALDLARLAHAVARRLPRDCYEPAQVADREAAALAATADALRALHRYPEARTAFAQAWSRLRAGSGEPAERASLLSLQSSLARDLGRYEEAFEQLESARLLYRRLGDRHREGHALFLQARLRSLAGDPQAASQLLQESMPLLDFTREPSLELAVVHESATCLLDTGRAWAAHELLHGARPLYRKFDDTRTRLSRIWLQGRILGRVGEVDEAIDHLLRALLAFEELGSGLDLLLCALDLCALYATRGKLEEAHAALEQGLEGLRRRDPAEAGRIAGVAAASGYDAGLLRRMALALRRSWHLLPRPAPGAPGWTGRLAGPAEPD